MCVCSYHSRRVLCVLAAPAWDSNRVLGFRLGRLRFRARPRRRARFDVLQTRRTGPGSRPAIAASAFPPVRRRSDLIGPSISFVELKRGHGASPGTTTAAAPAPSTVAFDVRRVRNVAAAGYRSFQAPLTHKQGPGITFAHAVLPQRGQPPLQRHDGVVPRHVRAVAAPRVPDRRALRVARRRAEEYALPRPAVPLGASASPKSGTTGSSAAKKTIENVLSLGNEKNQVRRALRAAAVARAVLLGEGEGGAERVLRPSSRRTVGASRLGARGRVRAPASFLNRGPLSNGWPR